MKTESLITLVVAILVATAGCGSGVDEPNGDAEQPTDSPVTTPSATATPSLATVELPDGVSESGLTDRDSLLSAHRSALNATNATVRIHFQLEVNGSGQNTTFLGKVTPGDDKGWMRISLSDGTGEYYTEGETTYAKVTQNGQTKYDTTDQVSALPSRDRFGADLRIGDALRAANWTTDGVVQRNGTTLIRLVASNVTVPDSVNTTQDATVESNGVLLVDQSGVIHHISVYSRVESANSTVIYQLSVSMWNVGNTTITRPEWVDRAD